MGDRKRAADQEPLHPFFAKHRKGGDVLWTVSGSLLVGRWREPLHSRERVAAFDFDGTLAGVQGPYVYPKHGDDWVWVHPSIPAVIGELHRRGWHIAILSNQKGILSKGDSRASNRKAAFKGRIWNVIQALERETGLQIPVMVYASTEDDEFRKPRPGMWHALLRDLERNGVNLEHSFYVGDAAGRPEHWTEGRSKDFADTDFKFALNSKLKFFVPEQVFHSKAIVPPMDVDETPPMPFKVATLPDVPLPRHPSVHVSETQPDRERTPSQKGQKMVIFVGPPASGKSFYYKTFYEPKGYVRINQDSLKSKARCLSKAKQELDSGSSVVIDNTNPDPATRKEYIKIAKEYSVPVKCVYFDVPEEICLHNNAYRELHEKDKKRVPGIAYHSFYTKFQLPCLDEGFDSVETVNWYPRFNSEQAKEAWQLFYS